MDTLPVNGHGHGENGLTLAPSAPLTPTTSSSSIRNQLLENIAHQAHLVEALFAEIIHHAGSSSSSSATSSASSSTLISTYTSLHDASVDQSRLLERARRHQARYERLVRHKESVDRLERAVVGLSRGMSDGDAGGGGGGGLLFELAEIANEAKEVVRRGRKVKDSIDRAQRAQVHTTDLLAYAHLLAPYSAPATFDKDASSRLLRAPVATTSGPHFLYPTEGVLAAGRLGEMARGQVLSDRKGDVQDEDDMEQVVQDGRGTAAEAEARAASTAMQASSEAQMPSQGFPTPQAQPALAAAEPQRTAAPPPPAPFKLDLDSDSDDD